MNSITMHVLDVDPVIASIKTLNYQNLLKRYKSYTHPEDYLIDKFLLSIMESFDFYTVINCQANIVDYEEHEWIMGNHNAITDLYRLLRPLRYTEGTVTLRYKRTGTILFLLVYN